MKLKRNSYLLRLLCYFIAGSLLPVVLVGVLVVMITGYMMQEDLVERSTAASEVISEDIDALADTYGNILHSLSQEEEIQRLLAGEAGISINDGYSRLYLVASGHTGDAQFHILSGDGRVRISTGVIGEEYTLPRMGSWGILRQASASAGVVLASSDKSREGAADYAFSMATAITSGGRPVGFAVVDVRREAVIRIMQNRAVPTSVNCLLADRYDYLCVNQRDARQEGFRGLGAEFRERMAGERGHFYLTGEDRYLVAYHRSGETGLQVVQQVTPTVVNRFSETLLRVIVAVVLISAAVLPLVAYALTGKLWKPLEELTRAMSRVREEDFSVRLEIQHNYVEFQELGNTFNKMTAHIQTLVKNIEDKQRLLRIAQVEALQAQVKPHFIYNTLDLIKWGAKAGDMDGVVDLSVQLGRLLRRTISGDSEFVTVLDEAEMLRSYLAIQQRRFAERMTVRMSIAPDILDCLIPRLILQPIVENAVTHGLEEKRAGGLLEITGRREGDYLHFVVEDNGRGMSEQKAVWLLDHSNSQIGVRNVHLRAKLHGDESCGLFIDSREGKGTKVILLLRETLGKEEPREEGHCD